MTMRFTMSILMAWVVFAFSASAWATPHTQILYRFSGRDGGGPRGPFVFDSAGNLYGVTYYGGQSSVGVVFQLSPPAVRGGTWTEKVLYSFTGGADGGFPNSGLTLDSSGNLYGTTYGGATAGVAFQLSPPAVKGGSWNYSVLHSFSGVGIGDGAYPNGSLARDSQGNLFGTTQMGGGVFCNSFPGPCGEVFELSPPALPGNPWTETVLYSFGGVPDGQFPYGNVILDSRGNLFGTTNQGGNGQCTDGESLVIGCGTVFELSATGGTSVGTWTESILYNFQLSEQNMPGSGLTLSGNGGGLYGTAGYTVFGVVPPSGGGTNWTKRTLYTFTEGISGTIPSSGVSLDPKGNLYGTTTSSGLSGFSTAFELSPPVQHGSWTETTLATFAGGFNGNQPVGGLVRGKFGWLYGATSNGAPTGKNGYVFAIIP